MALRKAAEFLGIAEEAIFMAEPHVIGYKRRKNLPDLATANQLYDEDDSGNPVAEEPLGENVLDSFRKGVGISRDPVFGFWVSLVDVVNRRGIRLDPKYRWLWDHQKGVVKGNADKARPLSDILEIAALPKVAKGELLTEMVVIDLEYVERRQGLLADPPRLETLGSEKIQFDACDLAISKLEPYLGKILIQPPKDALGSTEWVGLKVKGGIPVTLAAYFLMHPDLCEGYRRLQSGKRHARFDPREFLKLRAELPSETEYGTLSGEIESHRASILEMRRAEQVIRGEIDRLLGD